MTVFLTVTTMVLGVLLGIVLALMRLSANPVFTVTSGLFVWFFRGVPPLVQIIFWFNLALLLPNLTIAVPFGPTLWQVDTNDVMTPLTASLVSLTLIEAAYSCEIVRAGIQSVNEGQRLAARSLGMSPWLSFRRIVLPQAMGVIIPPLGNDASGMLKTTALVSVIAMPELLYSAQTIYTQNYQVIPLLVVASIWYLVVTSALSIVQYFIERHYGRHRASAPTARRMRLRALVAQVAPQAARGGN
jgi:polar amino acid transport system permease protein